MVTIKVPDFSHTDPETGETTHYSDIEVVVCSDCDGQADSPKAKVLEDAKFMSGIEKNLKGL